jgi:putrescine transport system ATP-binding protein
MSEGFLNIANVTKRFGDFTAVDDLSLDIAAGEFFALLGPSGCGKSTLLRLIAGFEQQDAGDIRLDGKVLSALPPHLRPVNMMFQSYALFPHMSVARNIAFGLRQERLTRNVVTARVSEMLKLVQLEGLGERKPHQLSGGQKQRVALARALVKQPKVLLLDEPLAALDKKLRQETQSQLLALHRKLGTTFVIVTHDQEEAMMLASRMAVMERGKIAQIGTPAEIYERPATRYVAGFIGDANMIEGTVARVDPLGSQVDCGGAGYFRIEHVNRVALGTRVTVAIRPEKLRITSEGPTAKSLNVMQGTLTEVSYLGETSHYRVKIKDAVLTASLPNQGATGRLRAAIGDSVWLSFALDGASVLER